MLDQDFRWPTVLVDFPAPLLPVSTQEQIPNKRRRLHFQRPKQWLVAHDATQVPELLQAVYRLSLSGMWCVGWVSYEAAAGLNDHLPVKASNPGAVYAAWAIFDQAFEEWPALTEENSWGLGPWQKQSTEHFLADALADIHELIRAGEVYQINLTCQNHSEFKAPHDTSSLHYFFRALHRAQPNGYALMLDSRTATRSPGAVLSVSPELFFEWDGQRIVTRPMKGTAPRHVEHIADQAAAQYLQSNDKEKAENLMIVDLLRNDLSKISQVGSVCVDSLFDVQALPTVWQMTSTVSALTRPEVTLADIFTALFPCGSVTGAPKQRAMHHIARLEQSPRGIYCGAMGILMPGGHATFNVPIRTVCVNTPPPDAPWHASCGIGSGITIDSSLAGETKEWQHKQRFLQRASMPFDLIESMRLENGFLLRLPLHMARLAKSAQHFGFANPTQWPAWEMRIVQSLTNLTQQHPYGLFKLRLQLSAQGNIQWQAQTIDGPLGMVGPPQTPALANLDHVLGTVPSTCVALANTAMPTPDDFIWHKTTRREVYQRFSPQAPCFDTLLFNASGNITEFTIGNVAVYQNGQWLTPALECGLLPGIVREELLKAHVLKEACIPLDSLKNTQAMIFMNSVRGILPVQLMDPIYINNSTELAGH